MGRALRRAVSLKPGAGSPRLSIRGLVILLSSAILTLMTLLLWLVRAERDNADEVAAAEHQRYVSYQAAIHLMQTSNDLTRMARQFVITGDPRFDRYYHRILAIRNGSAPRPSNYDPFYWDRVLAGTETVDERSRPKALRQLLRDLSFTPAELDALAAAQAESDRLALIEEVAIAAIRAKAARRRPGQPLDNAAETDAMANAAYQAAKGRIMAGIQACLQLVDQRTLRAVQALQAHGERLRQGIIIAAAGVLVLIALSVALLILLVLRPVGALVTAAGAVERGDYGMRIVRQRTRELQRLALSFNRMTDAVERNIQRLGESEGAARQARQRLQQITDHLPGAVYDFRMTPNGQMYFDFIGPGLAMLMPGVLTAGYLGDARNAMASVHEDDRAALMASILACASPPRPWAYEYRVCLPDGHVRWLRGQSRPSEAPDPDGAWHWFGVLTDITAQKELEVQLAEARDAAEAASRAKSTFLATMSHELRTPMIGITGMLEVLTHGRLNPEQMRQVAIIQQSARALLSIIGDILDFSKIEAGKLDVVPAHVAVGALAEALANDFRYAASSKGLRLDCVLDPQLAPAHQVDAVRLRQILGNFLSNAVKFTAQGAIELRVQVLEQDSGAQRLAFSVRDTGIGISEDDQAKLFQPFQQAESSTTRRHGGTGLGLVICQRLAELMGGAIVMQSRPGVGTIITLTLGLPLGDPARVDEAEAAPQRVWKRRRPSRAEAIAEKSLLLLVEDHPTNRIVLSHQLELAGFVFDLAEDGVDGLEKWYSGRYALVFTDLHMPRMDGFQMATAIRAGERERGLARTPIVALTAAAMSDQMARCAEAGIDDVLFKPTSIASLSAKLHQWLPQLAWLAEAAQPASAVADRRHGADRRVGAEAPAPPALLDENVLLETAGGQVDVCRRILDDFLVSTRGDLQALAAAVQARDAAALTRGAHRLLGASRMVGAQALAQAAAELEAASRQGDEAALAPALAHVDQVFESVERYAAQRRAEAKAAGAPMLF